MDLFKSIEENVNWLKNIGADPTGGTTRLIYTKSWIEAQNGLKKKFEEIGMKASFDSVGNLFGRIEGTQFPEETILSGSHIDTVINGGGLDGQFGIIGAYLAIQYLLDTYGKPLRSLEAVSFSEEEGVRFSYTYWGSKSFAGLTKKEETLSVIDLEGVSIAQAMEESGFYYNIDEDKKFREDIKAYLELHIEQGNVLEINKQSVGIVTGIVGVRRYHVTLKGQSNHAGTTPMGYRRDAVYGFSKICGAAIEKAEKQGEPLVLTFGKVIVKPNAANVIPGEVKFSIDCRHTDRKELIDFTEELKEYMRFAASEMGLAINIEMILDEPPVMMNENIVTMLKDVCESQQMHYRVMHSGAGHDAQIIAPFVPSGMIFVPSIGGISHNPEEHTRTEDLADGVMVLAKALYELAYK